MEVIDVENFVGQMGMAMQGKLSIDQEYELQDVAAQLMADEEIEPDLRDLFKSSFMLLSKKQKRFLDLRKYNRLMKERTLN